MSSTDLVVISDDSKYPVLSTPQEELMEIVSDALAPGEKLGIGDLTRIKVPAGGGTQWLIPSLSTGEDEAVKELRGVIISRATRRGLWVKEFEGGNERPDCASIGGLVGSINDESDATLTIPDGQACASCPYNEFETATKGSGKACKETRQLFMFVEGELLPIMLNIPPGSLKNAKQYFVGLLKAGLKSGGVETVMKLIKVPSAGGIDYAQVVFTVGNILSPEAARKMKEYGDAISPAIDAAKAADLSAEDLND